MTGVPPAGHIVDLNVSKIRNIAQGRYAVSFRHALGHAVASHHRSVQEPLLRCIPVTHNVMVRQYASALQHAEGVDLVLQECR